MYVYTFVCKYVRIHVRMQLHLSHSQRAKFFSFRFPTFSDNFLLLLLLLLLYGSTPVSLLKSETLSCDLDVALDAGVK